MSARKEVLQRFVYRALRGDEDPRTGLMPPASTSSLAMSIAEAIAIGSSSASPYIHATLDAHIAIDKYATDRVAIVDLQALPEEVQVVDGVGEAWSESGLDNAAERFARSDKEVVIVGAVPCHAIAAVVSASECKVGSKRLRCSGSLHANMKLAQHHLGIVQAEESVMFKVAGVSKYSEAVRMLSVGQIVVLHAEPDNPYDGDAVRIDTVSGGTIGYIPRRETHRAKNILVEGSRSATVEKLIRWDGPTAVQIAV